jgi:hypothetical protein
VVLVVLPSRSASQSMGYSFETTLRNFSISLVVKGAASDSKGDEI